MFISKFNYKCKVKEKFINVKLKLGLDYFEVFGFFFYVFIFKFDEIGVKWKLCIYR